MRRLALRPATFCGGAGAIVPWNVCPTTTVSIAPFASGAIVARHPLHVGRGEQLRDRVRGRLRALHARVPVDGRVEVVEARRVARSRSRGGGVIVVAALGEQVARIAGRARDAVAVQDGDRRLARARACAASTFRPSATAVATFAASTSGCQPVLHRRLDVRRVGAQVGVAGQPLDLRLEEVARGKVVGEERVAEDRLAGDARRRRPRRPRCSSSAPRRSSAPSSPRSCARAGTSSPSRTAAGARRGRGRSRCAGSARSRAPLRPVSCW